MIYFSQVNNDEIKKYYEYSLDKQSAEDITTDMRVLFDKRVLELKILQKMDEFETKFKHFKGSNESKNEYKKLYSELILEYNNIIDRANEMWEFNLDLLRSIEYKKKEIYTKTGKNGYSNINKEILNNEIEAYAKFDKDIIIIKNKINDLINLISI